MLTGPGATLLRRLPLAIISRAVGAAAAVSHLEPVVIFLLDNTATPCSVKAYGRKHGSQYFCEPVTNCDRFNSRALLRKFKIFACYNFLAC
jgi:hypothetical protein